MPLYEYECGQCGRFEVIRKFSDEPLTACPTCGKPIEKLLSSPAIQFKGTGWYVTDYAGKSSAKGGKSEKSEKSDGGKSEGGKDAGGGKSETSSSAPPAASTTGSGSGSGSSKT
jgi:putative FmdB family regulatory protein